MDFNFNLTPSDALPQTMDFLSHAWCNIAVQALQPELQDQPVILVDNPIKKLEGSIKAPLMKMKENVKMDDADFSSLPPLKYNDVQSWISVQQAMHPELNYNSYFRKKWMPWKQMVPSKIVSIKKWLKEMKQRRKEEDRLQRAEVHAAVSVAGLAAALAVIATENKKNESNTVKEAAVASAAGLVAAQCAKVAEAMGAKKERLSNVLGSSMTGTTASDILMLTAAAATSLRGANTLKARSGFKNRLHGNALVLPIEGNNVSEFDFERGRSVLAKGAQLFVKTPEGNSTVRSVSVILNGEAKIILKMRKLNLLKSKKESIVLKLHAELYNDSEAKDNKTCYLIVLTTSRGIFKLDMEDNSQRYRTWASTINHMLILTSSFKNYK
ncbi:VAN3-binding protein [Quillaja saponaria]|uniref:VAN3-binding protein n=1 Tax=Quillaja saponaria TaxID=32244 RepID=A0AAD7VL05_QUISA|nr:VAN3-binding protein [Quillaja saponaria]